MERLEFKTTINAASKKVWDVLWKDDTYRKWTSVFHEGSYVKSEWKEGGSVEFLSPEGDGMYAEIAKMEVPKVMSFRHIAAIRNGARQPLDANSRE